MIVQEIRWCIQRNGGKWDDDDDDNGDDGNDVHDENDDNALRVGEEKLCSTTEYRRSIWFIYWRIVIN